MKKIYIFGLLLSSIILAWCVNNINESENSKDINNNSKNYTSIKDNLNNRKNTEKKMLNNNMVFETLSPIDFKKKLEEENDFVVIDVRTPEELKQSGVIYPNVLNLNLYDPDFVEKLSKLDKNKTYFIYCRSGSRSARAFELMRRLWFKKVYNLDTWILWWDRAWFKFYPYNPQSLDNTSNGTDEYKEIVINAKQWEFDKPIIRVKQWEKVKLIINNLDVLHWIDIPDLNQWDESELILDTSKKGEYIYLCWNYCGKGHSKMRGKIIIE